MMYRITDSTGSEKQIIKGQEAICPDGLGRVSDFSTGTGALGVGSFIKVDTYVDNRGCEWAPHNVELIDPRK